MSNPLPSSSSRRTFLQAALAGAAVPSLGYGAEPAPARPDRYLEPARELPLRDDADVMVCGGGPAGVAAALAAARSGARTRLFELHGCLGGVWTAGLLTYIFDFDKPGLTRELTQRLDQRDARRHKNPSRFVYEPEAMKLLLEELCGAAGVKLQLHTRVAAAHRVQSRLTTVITESASGREAWRARVFIDATGDGDLGAQAGCEWEIGQGRDCPCQPMTLNALVTVRDAEAIKDCISFHGGGRVEPDDVRQQERIGDAVCDLKSSAQRIRERMHRPGVDRAKTESAVVAAERQRGSSKSSESSKSESDSPTPGGRPENVQ